MTVTWDNVPGPIYKEVNLIMLAKMITKEILPKLDEEEK